MHGFCKDFLEFPIHGVFFSSMGFVQSLGLRWFTGFFKGLLKALKSVG